MIDMNSKERLKEIMDGAGKLSLEEQAYILTTIKGMLFTRACLTKQLEEKHFSQHLKNDSSNT